MRSARTQPPKASALTGYKTCYVAPVEVAETSSGRTYASSFRRRVQDSKTPFQSPTQETPAPATHKEQALGWFLQGLGPFGV